MKTIRKSAARSSKAARSASRKPTKAGSPATITDPSTIIRHGEPDVPPPVTALYAVVIANSQDGTEEVALVDTDEERCRKYAANYSDPKIRPLYHHAEVRRIDPTTVLDERNQPIFKHAKPLDAKAARLKAAATAEPFATVARQFVAWLTAMSVKSTGGDLPAKALAGMLEGVLFEVFTAIDTTLMEAGETRGYAACECRVKSESETTNSGEAR